MQLNLSFSRPRERHLLDERELRCVPSWLAAIGTVGALGAALWQIGNERARRVAADEEARADRHIEQARLITAYSGRRDRR